MPLDFFIVSIPKKGGLILGKVMLAWILISASSFAGQDGTLCVPNPAFPSQKVHTKTGTAASAQLEFGIKWDGFMPFFRWSRARTASTWRVFCYPWGEGKPGQRGSSAPTSLGINPKSRRAEGRCWKTNKLPESSAKVGKASGRNKPSLVCWHCSSLCLLFPILLELEG